MRCITAEERTVLLKTMPSSGLAGEPMAKDEVTLAHSLHRRGDMEFEGFRIGDDIQRVWNVTPRGRLALACFAAVNARIA